ncbi:translocation/assembly module TamB domain-containing protein [Bdellovibrio bacteriovorus]|uniref:translocation/assembly module TamB domain-containing protein n=1 Tax=Bdellovibrio bacteriovorus TaxID=959 RepID=UPI0035A65893
MKRAFWILITPLAGFLVLWLVLSWWVAPQVESWALNQIQTYSANSLPVNIRAEKLHLKLFRPSATLEGIEVTGKGELAESLRQIKVASVRIYIDVFHLLAGKLKLSAIVVDSPEADINVDPFMKKDTPPKELPMDAIFNQLEQLPLQRIFLQNIHVKVSSQELKFDVTVKSGDLLVTNMGKNLTAKVNIPSLDLGLTRMGHFQGSLDTHLYLTRQSLRIIQLGLRLDESELLARGELTKFSQILIRPSGVLDLSAKINLSDVQKELKKLNVKLPAFSGELNTEVEGRFDGLDNIVAKADINTRALVIDKFELGDSRIQGEYKDQTIRLSEVKVQHPAGEAVLTKSEIELDRSYQFKSKISVPNLDLQKLFQSLDLGGIPVGVEIAAELPCEGQIYPTFQVTCTGVRISGQDLWVKSANSAKGTAILNVDHLKAQGQVQVTTKSVTYAANLSVGESSGSTDGVIDFATGFKINYGTKKLDMKDVKNLAGLKLQGFASIDGSTSGDSNAAIFDMNLNARNFVFEDFTLGNLITNLKYRGGRLLFEDIAGAVNKTQYLGDLEVNLNKNTLGGEFSIPTADLADVAVVFERIYKLPFAVQGLGAAKARVDGPLNFWRMNYHLESAFKKVIIGPEIFDSLIFNVSADNGNIRADNVILQKGASTVTVQGGIGNTQIMNLYADGKNWKLEESDFINKINSTIAGNLNFAAELKDAVTSPNILVKGAITDTFLEEQEFPNSNFILRTNKDAFSAQLSLFGDKVQGEFQIPFERRAPLIVKMKTLNWNFSNLLGIVGGASLANEYQSNLTSTIDLRSESGELFKSTGKLTIQNFSLKRGPMSFANQGPMEITSDNGLMNIRNFRLEGPQNSLSLRGENFTSEKLNVGLNLKADLRLFQIFTPFLEDLGGPVDVTATVSGPLLKPEVIGNANTRNTFIKIKGFPHPIEKLSTDVVFSQSKILINSIKGYIAGGTLSGDGGVSINGIKDLPTSIRLHMEGVTFNVPDKVKSSGRADLLFAGRWFPFVLSGTYFISNGVVEKEFTEDGGVAGVRQSLYLPKVIKESNFEPVVLDLQLIMERNIIVKNSLIDGSVNGNLQVKGPPGNPVLLGKIAMDKNSKLIFKDKVFNVQSGVVEFTDPDEINPNLYVSAISRIDEYDITVIAQGTAKNLAIRLNSVPPLSEQDIISLIALGITSSSMEQNMQSRQQAEQLGAEIGGAVLAKPISRFTESALGVNVQVTSEYDSTRNISVPKITLSRPLSERVKMSGSRPVGDSSSYDLKLEYFLNSNWTAIGSYENRGAEDNTTLQNTQPAAQSVFGLDLEFKREFK